VDRRRNIPAASVRGSEQNGASRGDDAIGVVTHRGFLYGQSLLKVNRPDGQRRKRRKPIVVHAWPASGAVHEKK